MNIKRRHLALLWSLPLLIAAATGLTCNDGEEFGELIPEGDSGYARITVEQMNAFDQYPVYWAGESIDGLKLWKIHHYVSHIPEGLMGVEEDEITIVYGECKFYHGSCEPLLWMRTQPACVRPYRSAAGLETLSPREYRGALAAREEGYIRLWSGDVTIVVGGSRRDLWQLAIRSIEVANAGATGFVPRPDGLLPEYDTRSHDGCDVPETTRGALGAG